MAVAHSYCYELLLRYIIICVLFYLMRGSECSEVLSHLSLLPSLSNPIGLRSSPPRATMQRDTWSLVTFGTEGEGGDPAA